MTNNYNYKQKDRKERNVSALINGDRQTVKACVRKKKLIDKMKQINLEKPSKVEHNKNII